MLSHFTLFVTSADGYTGNHLVRTLASSQWNRYFRTIYAGVTDEQAGKDLERLDKVKVVRYDPDNRDDLERRFRECHLVYVIPPCSKRQGKQDDGEVDDGLRRRWDQDAIQEEQLGSAGLDQAAMSETHKIIQRTRNMIDAAKQAKIRNVGLWSPAASQHASNHQILKCFHELERHFERSGIENRCLVRVQMYMQAFLLYARTIQERGELPMSTGSGKFAPVSLRDHSRFVACMIARKHGRGEDESQSSMDVDASQGAWVIPEEYRNRTFLLTGPESMNADEVARQATRAIGEGNTIRYKEVDREEVERILRRSGRLDRSEVRMFGEWFDVIRQGNLDKVSNDYERAVGRKPTPIREFFQDHQRDFAPRRN